MTDADGDGVADKFDLEKNTTPGVLVNSKGQTLDSDADGIADYQDREPFSPPGFPIDSYGVAQQPDLLSEAGRLVDDKFKVLKEDLPPPSSVTMLNDAAIVNTMLPALYFGVNSSGIGGRDLVVLGNVGNLMRTYPQLRLVVTGHSDKAGKEMNNPDVSYWRAKRVIDYLVSAFNISRSRFVLQYRANKDAVMESTHEANRRVQFRVATTEEDMAPPR
jgi:OOP family OmpA-OmpF porin